ASTSGRDLAARRDSCDRDGWRARTPRLPGRPIRKRAVDAHAGPPQLKRPFTAPKATDDAERALFSPPPFSPETAWGQTRPAEDRPALASVARPGMLRSVMSTSADSTRSARPRALDFLIHLPNLVRLYWRLLRDPRVSIWPKALLAGALAYVALPFDLIPDTLPLLGEVDDVVTLVAAAHWFIQWCPPEVVPGHVAAF